MWVRHIWEIEKLIAGTQIRIPWSLSDIRYINRIQHVFKRNFFASFHIRRFDRSVASFYVKSVGRYQTIGLLTQVIKEFLLRIEICYPFSNTFRCKLKYKKKFYMCGTRLLTVCCSLETNTFVRDCRQLAIVLSSFISNGFFEQCLRTAFVNII